MAKNLSSLPPGIIPAVPPKFVPSSGSPRVAVQEQRRAEQIPAAISSGAAALRFGDNPARPPFPNDAARQPSVPVVKPSAAGRSK
jgi:hypothetical protein